MIWGKTYCWTENVEMSESEYSAESEEYSSEDEGQESDMENEYDGGGDVGEVQVEGPVMGQIEKVESSCSSSSENLEDCQPKVT